MQQQKGREEKLKVDPSGSNTGTSKDRDPKKPLGAASWKCGFHSGIKFTGNPKKMTQFKPFSFDARPKTEKVTASKEKEVKPVSSDTRLKFEKVDIIKNIQLKPLRFELCSESDEAICMHEDGRTCESVFAEAFADAITEKLHSTPKSEKVENNQMKASKEPICEAEEKPVKIQKNQTEIKSCSSRIPQIVQPMRIAKKADVKRFGSDVPSKPEKVKDPKEPLLETNPSRSDAQPEIEKGLRKNYRAHSGIKFIPRKKGTVMKPFSFENRSSTLQAKPGSAAQDV